MTDNVSPQPARRRARRARRIDLLEVAAVAAIVVVPVMYAMGINGVYLAASAALVSGLEYLHGRRQARKAQSQPGTSGNDDDDAR